MATSIDFLKKALLNANIQAAIATIRHTEGTSAPDGFHYLYGSSPRNSLRFTDLSTHPNILQTHNGISSTAAGIGQWLHSTYIGLCMKYGITGFDEDAQMLLFVAQFDEINVLGKIMTGSFMEKGVQQALGRSWASFPLSEYGQPTHSLSDVELTYTSNGGVTASA